MEQDCISGIECTNTLSYGDDDFKDIISSLPSGCEISIGQGYEYEAVFLFRSSKEEEKAVNYIREYLAVPEFKPSSRQAHNLNVNQWGMFVEACAEMRLECL